jgi:cytoskeleton protein RodZ
MSVKGADGRTAFSGIVHGGQSQNIDAVRPMHVTVGNMSGVSAIEQDGHALNVKTYAGNGKNVAKFTIP